MPSTSAMFSATAMIDPMYLVSVGSTLLRPIADWTSAITLPISQRPTIQNAIAARTLIARSAPVVRRYCRTCSRFTGPPSRWSVPGRPRRPPPASPARGPSTLRPIRCGVNARCARADDADQAAIARHGSSCPGDALRTSMETDMKNAILLAYYSRTGYTRKVAMEIAEACGCDVEEIRDRVGRSGPIGYARSVFEAASRFDTLLQPGERDPADYPLVIVGTPVWFWNLSSPVRTWVRRHRPRLRDVAFFCTCGSSGGTRALA